MYVILVITMFVSDNSAPTPPWLADLEFVPACSSLKCGESAHLKCGMKNDEYIIATNAKVRRLECFWEAVK